MTKPLPSYEPGDKVRVAIFDGFPRYTGALAVVASVRGNYSGTAANGKVVTIKNCYKIVFLDDVVGIVDSAQLFPAFPPFRSDLDTLVPWNSLPPEVVKAMLFGQGEGV